MDKKAFRNISYGLYVVCSKKGDAWNGQISNTVMQITAEPATVAISVNKENLTHEYIEASGVFTISVLNQDVPMKEIGLFGFNSGRDLDKFKEIECDTGITGAPLLTDYIMSHIEAEVIDMLEIGTHTIFVGKVVGAEKVGEGDPLTYRYYHQVKKGKAPKTAPTYQGEDDEKDNQTKEGGGKYRCTICGYIYSPSAGDPENDVPANTSFHEVPDDWICPICGAGKNAFEPI